MVELHFALHQRADPETWRAATCRDIHLSVPGTMLAPRISGPATPTS